MNYGISDCLTNGVPGYLWDIYAAGALYDATASQVSHYKCNGIAHHDGERAFANQAVYVAEIGFNIECGSGPGNDVYRAGGQKLLGELAEGHKPTEAQLSAV